MPSNNSKYTPEIRQRTVNYILESGKLATSVAEEMGIGTNTVCKCVREYRRSNQQPTNHEEKSHIANLTNMNLWLKLRRNTKPKPTCERKRILGQSIELRPQEVNDRSTFGHWEIDTVMGKKTKGEPVLLTLVERLTRYMLVLKIKAKDEASVKEAIQSMVCEVFTSMTQDAFLPSSVSKPK